jgi:YVTN family beta-propeller protein
MRNFVLNLFLISSPALAADLPYVNFENHPVRALDISPDGATVAASHTADQRVQFFDVSGADVVRTGHVLTGVDPVAVKFRNDQELWVVNHLSDSITIVDTSTRSVKLILRTADEPFDVVFANNLAFVSCSQVNTVQVFDLANLNAPPREIEINAEDPRALAVSPDGRWVYVAIFESGNASTTLQGGIARNAANLANAVSDSRGPYQGQNPPPNSGNQFKPAINPVATPPEVSLIVKRAENGQWFDDNSGDWTRFVSGDLAGITGRVRNWNVVDRDIAVIDTQSLSVRYETSLMNMVMGLGVRANGEVTAIGTDALNEIRYEPNLTAQFVRVKLARVTAAQKQIDDLNPHLDYANSTTLSFAERVPTLGDPRAIVWNQAGTRGYISGLGSNNVIIIDDSGHRVGSAIAVGEGPTGMVLQEARNRLLVWNHFAVSLSVVDLGIAREIASIRVFNPLPDAIKTGRKFFYDTQLTSGLGQASCASCHVDGRFDRLAWDLGDPSKAPAAFDQNCATSRIAIS